MPFIKGAYGAPTKRKVKRTQVAGPYRSESSVPSIRKKATKREHRVVSAPKRGQGALGPPRGSGEGERATSSLLAVPSLPKAIERKQRSLKRETQRKIKRIRALDSLKDKALTTIRETKLPPEPHTIYQRARAGTFPPQAEAKTNPRAYKRATKIALAKLGEKEGLKEDPLAEAVIATVATAGLGGAAKIAATAAEKGAAGLIARGGSQAAQKTAKAAGGLTKRSANRVVSGAERKVAKVKATPARVKELPNAARRAGRQVRTKEGRRAAAQQTARSARRHPVRSGYGATVALPEGALPGDATERARAFAEGSARALLGHPSETLETTGRSLAGAITGPAALLGAAASSVKHGTPEPLVRTAEEEAKGVAQIASNAFSGDAEKAELAARKEGSLALATPLPALTRLPAFKRGRKRIRTAAASKRRKLAGRSERLNRNVRHAPEGVETNVIGKLGKREQRKKAALVKQRVDNPMRVQTAHHEAAITHAAARAPKGSDVAIQALAEYGVRGPKGAALLRHKGPSDKELVKALDYAEKHPEIYKSKEFEETLDAVKRAAETAPAALVGRGERARLLAQGDLLGVSRPEHMVPGRAVKLTSARTREGAWDDLHAKDLQLKALRREARSVQRQAKRSTKEVADLTRALRSKQLEAAKLRERLGFRERRERLRQRKAGVYKKGERQGQPRLQPLAQMQRERRALLHAEANVRGLYAELRAKKGAHATAMKTAVASRFKQARDLEASNKALYDALKDYVHPDHKIDQSKRKVYDDEMLQTYKAEVEAGRKAAGLAPAIWTHHSAADRSAGAGLEGGRYSKAAGVEHMREGTLAGNNNLDRSLEGIVHGTVRLPRQRAAGREFMRSMVDEFKVPFTKNGKQTFVGRGSKDWLELTKQGGQFDPKSWGRFPFKDWKNALKDPYLSESQRSAQLLSILKDAEAGKVASNEPWVLMPREAIKEALAQIDPKHGEITKGLNVFGRISNRALLGTNPGWAIAQTVAEGIPLAMAHPELLLPHKIPSLYRDILRYRRENPENALALEATAGATPISSAALRTPLDMQETYTPALWDKGAKALTRGKTARTALSFAKLRTLGEIDARRQNAYRTVLYAAEADKRFRAWHSGLTGLFDRQASVVGRFRGKSRSELWAWLEKDPVGRRERRKIEDYVDDVAGNWTAFTRYERAFGPAAIFYGFLRYSLRWAVWAFPKRHPIVATTAYMLGQANANQIDKLVGEGLYGEGLQDKPGPAKPGNPLAYAYPVYSGASGERSVLPGGSRISPGQSSLTQALSSGNPAAVLSSANPFLSAGITGLTGVEPLSGEESSMPRGYAALKALINLPAPGRIRAPEGTPLLDGQSIGERILGALGAPERSVASKAYEQYDPGRTFRSVVYPGLPQTAGNFKNTEVLSKAFDSKYGGPNQSLPAEVWDAAYKGDWRAAEKLRRKRLKQERGGDLVKLAEEGFFDGDGGELSKEGSEILRYITGLIQFPDDSVKRPRRVKRRGGIGGSTSGGIGGVPLGGGGGGSIGGSAGGSIGGVPLGR